MQKFAVVATFIAIAAIWVIQRPTSAQQREDRVQQWEYKLVRGHNTAEATLGSYGSQGWELVAVTPEPKDTGRVIFALKRPRKR